MQRHLGINFLSILMDFGSQVGRQNRAKINKKWHRKTMGLSWGHLEASWSSGRPLGGERIGPDRPGCCAGGVGGGPLIHLKGPPAKILGI